MTIGKAIGAADALKPNQYDIKDKIMWLSELDGKINAEIISPCGNDTDFKPYADNESGATELVVKYPYDGIYITYLSMKIDLANGELDKYNNGSAIFYSELASFGKWYTRNHRSQNKTKLKFV